MAALLLLLENNNNDNNNGWPGLAWQRNDGRVVAVNYNILHYMVVTTMTTTSRRCGYGFTYHRRREP